MTANYQIKRGDKIHFVGIGGIGMSALAQFFVAHGCQVSGSDRGASQSENQAIIAPLKAQNIKIFPQDGSFVKKVQPDCLIYSSAIEEDNPDFLVACEIPRVHRAEALAIAINLNKEQISIAVAGSCGKTSVTAWLAEALYNLKADPACLNGGLINSFRNENCAGNYQDGKGKYFVFEADESDKSLLVYQADYVLLLNIGTDHYDKEELIELFAAFAASAKKALIVEDNLYELIKHKIPKALKIVRFSSNAQSYKIANENAVLTVLTKLGYNKNAAKKAVENFNGVWRRFDYAGKTANGARVYDDYAHNPEKIVSCVLAAQEMTSGKVFAVFQPHGFGPLGFMRDALLEKLEKTLRDEDEFILLAPFYAGGTSSFKPTSEEVIESYQQTGIKKYSSYASRLELKKYLQTTAQNNDSILIMGARDNSLSDYAKNLTCDN